MDKKQIIEDYLQGRHPIEQNSWEVPSAQELDNAEVEFDRLMEAKNKPTRRLRLWPLAAAACVAGIIAIFIAPPRVKEEQPPLALEEPAVVEQPPVVKEVPDRVEVQVQTETPTEKPKKAPKRKRVLPQEPQEELLLAEAETVEEAPTVAVRPRHPEMEEDPFLALAEQMQDIRLRGEQVRQEVAQLIDKQVNLQ